MRVALISDVHANLPALDAVLAHARQHRVDAIWSVGDLVGQGGFPDEVVLRIKQEDILGIAGNHELKVLQVPQKKKRSPETTLSESKSALFWTYDSLSADNREYLRALSQEIRLEVEGKRILITHGSPASNEELLGPDTPRKRLRELAQMADVDLIICGHSHRPFKCKAGNVWFINPGSVGRPIDGDPRACYGILFIHPGRVLVHHYRVPYDVQEAVARIREKHLPEELVEPFLRGTSLSAARQEAKEERPVALFLQDADHDSRLQAVLQLAESCNYEAGHAHQVTRLALQLFDELRIVHGLGSKERHWLLYAALLHDIGWIKGQRKHHKTSLRIIRESPLLPFDESERLIIGSVARYHRRALPSERHAHFARLKPAGRRIVSILAAILRVADGLDYTHKSLVKDLCCVVSPQQITVRCAVRQPADVDCQRALDKGELMVQAFGRKLAIEWHLD